MAIDEPVTSLEDRRRLTPTALKAFLRVVAAWGSDEQDVAALLDVPARKLSSIRSEHWTETLTENQFTRISASVGIYGELGGLFADGMADRWPNLPNDREPFLGRTAVEEMVVGGTATIIETRRYVEAMSAGL